MNIHLGILGFGIVGKSYLRFCCQHPDLLAHYLNKKGINSTGNIVISVWDAKPLSKSDMEYVEQNGAVDYSLSMNEKEFAEFNRVILISPGVDKSRLENYDNKFVDELDLFGEYFKKPTIAITGTLGKTTVTHLLTKLFEKVFQRSDNLIESIANPAVACGGNIGSAMLDFVSFQESLALLIIELSSFQLELNRGYAPDVAVITNWFANHLDRHKTMEQYVSAKLRLLEFQQAHQSVVLPLSLLSGDCGDLVKEALEKYPGRLVLVSDQVPGKCPMESSNTVLIGIDNGQIVVHHVMNGRAEVTPIINVSMLPSYSYLSNWLTVVAAAYTYGVEPSRIASAVTRLSEQPAELSYPHRLELCATWQNIDFYNDSKSTVVQATVAALNRLLQTKRPVILIVGGLSKGVDRSSFAAWLTTVSGLKKVYCFGKECQVFSSFSCFSSLENVLDDIMTIIRPGDQVLFSPSGSSFDLYRSFEHRGEVFKRLVEEKISYAEQKGEEEYEYGRGSTQA